MNSADDIFYRPTMNDYGQIAAMIAQASDALAAAAEALAEAARAMSTVTQNVGDNQSNRTLAGSLSQTHPTDVAGEDSTRGETQAVRQDIADRVNEHHLPNPPTETRLGSSISLPSESSSLNNGSAAHPVIPTPPVNPALLLSLEYEAEFGDKRDALIASPNLHSRGCVEPSEHNNLKHVSNELTDSCIAHEPLQSDAIKAGNMLLAFPKVEAGRNYINLKRVSDSLAFIAYMTMQSRRTVCVLAQYSLVNAYARALRSLTNGTVICPSGVADLSTTYKDYLGFMKSTPPALMILPQECLNIVSLRNASPDCFLHWGEPLSASLYISQVIGPSPPNLKSCLLITDNDTFNGSSFGVVPYSEATRNIIFGSNSPLSQLRARVTELLSTVGLPVVLESQAPSTHRNPQPSFSSITSQPPSIIPPITQRNFHTLLPGKHYIIIEEAKDVDAIPLIAFIALNSNRTVCRIPQNRSLSTYQQLINAIANVNAQVTPNTPLTGKSRKARIKSLQSEGRSLLLQTNDFNACSRALDALVHWGIPCNLEVYLSESNKAASSYMILTSSQYRTISSQLDLIQPSIKPHPFLQLYNISAPGPLLHDLRVRLQPFLLR
ncbi:unnamed protein product [Rhizoctonia solani]|uniref:Uncharacterized protein n=1 Tax=Rhizoctonia solani TaxID=456999 RepID=A0A8H3GTT1_9AGAM|nr:unnamed protein product [Rhizoctonia solani]